MKIETEFDVGEIVWDDLLGKNTKIIGISFSSGYTLGNRYRNSADTVGYWVDSTYLDGGRHPWELGKVK